MKLHRLTPTRWYWYLWPFVAIDEWRFEWAGEEYTVRNCWVGATVLLRGGKEIGRHRKVFHVASKAPFLESTVVDGDGKAHRIAVFIEAILTIKASIAIDGVYNEEGFI